MINPYKILQRVSVSNVKGSLYGEITEEAIQTLIDKFNIDDKITFIDIGSGYGRAIASMALKSNADCIGVEMIKERFDFSKKHFGNIPNLKLLEGTFPHDSLEADIYFSHSCGFTEKSMNTVLESIPKDKLIICNGIHALNWYKSKNIKPKKIVLDTTYGTAQWLYFKK